MLKRGFDMTAIRETKIAVRELDPRKDGRYTHSRHGRERKKDTEGTQDKDSNYVIPARYVPTLQDPRLNSFKQPFAEITQKLEKIVPGDDDDDYDDTPPPPAPNPNPNDEEREEQ
ncbi:hypothetical protein HYALB_00011107 [Hymenoscyphus albidus]|uniref:Uncharacterized protein n=1 Tax=Hymenoscyphus albidus TaxID=595503 RepID=A0A9N9LNG9_9HELO|nr:hypothetical protein HYALB_00011107 [Hymenoscyphus albidus]